ncbi:AAA family ATPase [Actinophytocola algeriensis]|uniref:Putative ATPase n=1 Tax=Actinophytocola algeriensis TaxID=1768010 RepID=A0A7W7VFA9_9PSEU|nr:AAA family ATPase [Actinophytocola algeriensis]MBB4908112.1 putative ATPase [Actinophytocola algeriensis]MBE1480142.1 putative ATPase [Actinophytocola algeriensis]
MYRVVTGGPGAGKTTLLNALAARGFPVQPEAGRAIIQAQQAIGGTALHTGDTALFAELMLMWDIRNHQEAPAGTVFFDRGVTDLVGYHLLLGREVPPHVARAAEVFRYDTVFVAPPWPEIYTTDAERGQDFAEAVRTHDAIVAGYRRHGYDPVPLPLASVEDRVAFVLS